MRMMKHPTLFLPLLAILCVASCQRKGEPENALDLPGREISFTASMGAYTKVFDTTFDEDDVVGLSISGPLTENNIPLTMTNGFLVPEKKLYWAEDQADNEPANFMAYYPYFPFLDPNNMFVYGLPTDQSSLEEYAMADILRARVASAPKDGEVHLPFSHIMSGIVVGVRDMMTSDSFAGEIRISNVDMNAYVYLDSEEDAVIAMPGSRSEPVTALSLGYNMFTAVVPPQTTLPGISVKLSSGEWVEFTADQELTFQPGKLLVANLVLQQDISTFTAEIKDWTDDALYFGGGTGQNPLYFLIFDESDRMMTPQEDGTFSGQITLGNLHDFYVYDAISEILWGTSVPNPLYVLDYGESAIIPLSGVNARPIRVSYPDTDEEVLNASLNPKTMQLTLSRPGEPQWMSIGTGHFLDSFFWNSTFRQYIAKEFEVEWEMDSLRPNRNYRIRNPYANWSNKEQAGYEEGGCLYLKANLESNRLTIPASYTGLHWTDGEEIWLSVEPGDAIYNPERKVFLVNRATLFKGENMRWEETLDYSNAVFTLPDGNRPLFYDMGLSNVTSGYDTEQEAYYFKFTVHASYDLPDPYCLIYQMQEGEEYNDELRGMIYERVTHPSVGGGTWLDRPYPGNLSYTIFVGGPGKYVISLYVPALAEEREIWVLDQFEIEAVNE